MQLLCIIIVTCSSTQTSGSVVEFSTDIHFNKCFSGNVLVVIFGVSIEDCLDECVKRSVCKSINYQRLTKVCELNANNVSPTLPIVHCSKFMYLDVRKNDQLLVQSTSACAIDTCQSEEKCDKLKTPTCVFSECNVQSLSLKNGNIYGNLNGIRDIRTVTCNEGFTLFGSDQIDCLPDGTWSDVFCEKTCTAPLTINNGIAIRAEIHTLNAWITTDALDEIFGQSEYLDGSWVEFTCYTTHTLQDNNVTECFNGTWTQLPTCIASGNGIPCTSNATCLVPDSECRDGLCRCNSMLSYAYDAQLCVPACVTFADTFQSEVGKKLNFLDDETYSNLNDTMCKAMCLDTIDFVCQSFEVSDAMCLTSASNAHDGWLRDAADFTYYQRDCLL